MIYINCSIIRADTGIAIPLCFMSIYYIAKNLFHLKEFLRRNAFCLICLFASYNWGEIRHNSISIHKKNLCSEVLWELFLGIPHSVNFITTQHQNICLHKCSVKHNSEHHLLVNQVLFQMDALKNNISLNAAPNIYFDQHAFFL
uniref:Uncharacterized protein n=1 Tax=Rhizophora mucronata TaxID=61149 RepID=A0A2P2K1Q9_RHIMU